ncbi:MAG: hypothetical protein AAFZ07_06495 [Actinomycetota bacterium]
MTRRAWTAEEFAALSPAEQDAVFDASVATDLDDVPAEFIDRVRTRFEARLAERDGRRSR